METKGSKQKKRKMKERTKMETKGSKQKREENEREEKQRMRCRE